MKRKGSKNKKLKNKVCKNSTVVTKKKPGRKSEIDHSKLIEVLREVDIFDENNELKKEANNDSLWETVCRILNFPFNRKKTLYLHIYNKISQIRFDLQNNGEKGVLVL